MNKRRRFKAKRKRRARKLLDQFAEMLRENDAFMAALERVAAELRLTGAGSDQAQS